MQEVQFQLNRSNTQSNSWVRLCRRISESIWFQGLVIGLITLNGIVIGLETSSYMQARYGELFCALNYLVVVVFVVEVVIKISAHAPRCHDYFRNGWNCFDFTVTVLSLLPAAGSLASLARMARLLRVMRIISAFPELRLIVATLIRSIPSMGHVVMLMGIIFYIYGVLGYHLFSEIDPQHWRSLGIALLTLFRIVTLEDWSKVMYSAMEVYPMAWIYFVSFVVCGTFVVVNLFIAVVINNLDEAKAERLKELTPIPDQAEILRELQATREALTRLQARIEKHDDAVREEKKYADDR